MKGKLFYWEDEKSFDIEVDKIENINYICACKDGYSFGTDRTDWIALIAY